MLCESCGKEMVLISDRWDYYTFLCLLCKTKIDIPKYFYGAGYKKTK